MNRHNIMFKGLIIPGHILQSDKKKTEGKCDQNVSPRLSDYDISIYNNIFNYLLL